MLKKNACLPVNFLLPENEDLIIVRAIGRCENPGVQVLFGMHNLTPLVEIGLTDLPKSGGAPPREDRLDFQNLIGFFVMNLKPNSFRS